MKTYENVWDAIGGVERNKLTLRSDLFINIEKTLNDSDKTDKELRQQLSITDEDLILLRSREHVREFTIDELCDIINKLGVKVDISFTLIEEDEEE